jgi:hypothetical protein
MDRSQVATQIEKLLSKLLFEKKGVKISVEPVSGTQHKSGEYPTWRKYIVNIHVDPYRYNNVTSDFNEDYYNFMSNAEDVISNNIKYIGIDDFEVLSKFIIDDKQKFIEMMEKIIYDKWEDVQMEYWIETEKNLPELDEITIYPRSDSYPEFSLYIGLKKQLREKDYTALWNALHKKLPISEMFVHLV